MVNFYTENLALIRVLSLKSREQKLIKIINHKEESLKQVNSADKIAQKLQTEATAFNNYG